MRAISHFRVTFYLCFELSPVHNLSYGNKFDLQDNDRARKTHFNMKGCAPRLGLKRRQEQLENGSFVPLQDGDSSVLQTEHASNITKSRQKLRLVDLLS